MTGETGEPMAAPCRLLIDYTSIMNPFPFIISIYDLDISLFIISLIHRRIIYYVVTETALSIHLFSVLAGSWPQEDAADTKF